MGRNAAKDWLLQLFFPDNVACFCCNMPARADAYGLCAVCNEKIRPAEGLEKPAHIRALTAGLLFDQTLHGAVHRLKYSGARHIAGHLARFIHLPPDWGADCIIPVPLHKKRLRERGFNQSALIARALADAYGLPVHENLLLRMRDTQTQTQLTREERAKNMAGAFAARPAVKGHTIILVDDVLTTGSTLSACAQALVHAGAAGVYAACACAVENSY